MKFLTGLKCFYYLLLMVVLNGELNLVSTITKFKIENSLRDNTLSSNKNPELNEFLQQIPNYDLIKIGQGLNNIQNRNQYYNETKPKEIKLLNNIAINNSQNNQINDANDNKKNRNNDIINNNQSSFNISPQNDKLNANSNTNNSLNIYNSNNNTDQFKNPKLLNQSKNDVKIEPEIQKNINPPSQGNSQPTRVKLNLKPDQSLKNKNNLHKNQTHLNTTNTRRVPKNIIGRMNLIPKSYKKIGDFLFSHKLYDGLGENKDEISLGRSSTIQIHNTTMGLDQFEKFIKSASANTLTKLSQPYLVILEKIRNMFDEKIMNKADAEITRLRTLNIEQAADAIVEYSNNVRKESDYWFYYYIAANVILRGRLVKRKADLREFLEAEKWNMNELPEFKASKIPLGEKPILEKGTDKYYDFLLEKDAEYDKILDYFRKLTIYQIKNATEGIFNDDLRNDSYLVKKNYTAEERKKKQHYNVTWVKNLWNPVKRKQIHMSNFNQNKNLFLGAKQTPFYRIMKKFPKGIIHHLHWRAAFADDDIYDSIENFITLNKQTKNLTSVIIKAEVYLRDRTRPNSFLEISSPRFYLIEDLSGFLNDYYVKKIFEEQKRVFNSQYKLSDGRCVIEPFFESAGINPDLKAFLFWRECNNSLLYNAEKIEMHEDAGANIKLSEKVLSLETLKDFLYKNSHIIEEVKDLIGGFLPNSYANTLFNIYDKVSVAVWFKFEMILGIYEALFDNDNLFIFLTQKLYKDLLGIGVTGVEFRQGYDLHKNNSRVKIIQDIFYNNGTNSIPVSFIVPGRKVLGKHKLRQILQNLEEAKLKNQTTIAGFDFFGYEDDPFTGARNFFTLNVKDLDRTAKQGGAGGEIEEDDFARMFRSLRSGNKLYLHAGETNYFPDYPVNNGFMRKFYINDNLIHAALLPNVARLGHGFAVVNNDLLMLIFRKKGIGLEICPTSNQALYYYPIRSNPIVRLLRYGLSVSVSPDDPGLFDYSGVWMDWFNLIMHTDLKPSEYYLLLRNSFLKSSIKDLNVARSLEEVFKSMKKFFESHDLKILNSQYYDLKLLEQKTIMTEEIKKTIIENTAETKQYLTDNVLKNPYFVNKSNPWINIYNGSSIHSMFRKTLTKGGIDDVSN